MIKRSCLSISIAVCCILGQCENLSAIQEITVSTLPTASVSELSYSNNGDWGRCFELPYGGINSLTEFDRISFEFQNPQIISVSNLPQPIWKSGGAPFVITGNGVWLQIAPVLQGDDILVFIGGEYAGSGVVEDEGFAWVGFNPRPVVGMHELNAFVFRKSPNGMRKSYVGTTGSIWIQLNPSFYKPDGPRRYVLKTDSQRVPSNDCGCPGKKTCSCSDLNPKSNIAKKKSKKEHEQKASNGVSSNKKDFCLEPKAKLSAPQNHVQIDKSAEPDSEKNQSHQQTANTNRWQSFVFAAPANFPIREFGSDGSLIEREGVVIYEDMEFRYKDDGRYELIYKVGTPKIPSEIRIQLQFLANGHWYTISLPPKCFDDKAKCGLKCRTVKICGHSRTIQALSEECKKSHGKSCIGPCLNIDGIRRKGTARFGTGLQGLGQFGSK